VIQAILKWDGAVYKADLDEGYVDVSTDGRWFVSLRWDSESLVFCETADGGTITPDLALVISRMTLAGAYALETALAIACERSFS
jgi:hypothetical protein